MKFRFPSHEVAMGFADGLAAPGELDVYATVDGDELEVPGLDDHCLIAPEIRQMAKNAGATELPETGDAERQP